MASQRLRRKRSASEHMMPEERTLMKPRLTAGNSEYRKHTVPAPFPSVTGDYQAAVVHLEEPCSTAKMSSKSGKDVSELRLRNHRADWSPVVEPSQTDFRRHDLNLLGLIRSDAQSLVSPFPVLSATVASTTDTTQGRRAREGGPGHLDRGSTVNHVAAAICKPRDLRLLDTDGRSTDEFFNTIPVPGDFKDTGGSLLSTFVVQLIREARFKDLDHWTATVPNKSKP
ncbi:hypothetical protein LTR56_024391 [Elasticomyces elasticus]|nr:hypothetical protein LTR56_024391 [Elasticomyces elasticus]KAK3622763.1 hypothetical protein LTR22_024656 [Elasticomyces elasticus]KAK4906831.1 hypothetical protein LTR49_024073 [Elasticomyces elasticus]